METFSYKTLTDSFSEILVPTGEYTKYAHDQGICRVAPQLVFRPRNQAECVDLVRTISELQQDDASLSVTVRAAGTGLSGGSLTDSVVLDIMNVNSVIARDLDSAEPSITVETGMYYRAFAKQLDDCAYTMPIFPSSRQWCAIGGMIGNNAAGENTLKYGAQDAFVTRLQVIFDDGNQYICEPVSHDKLTEIMHEGTRRGEIYTALYRLVKNNWSQVRNNPISASKNVAGYPLWKLLSNDPEAFEAGDGVFDPTRIIVGAQGTLGIVTTVTYRLVPHPTLSDLVVIPVNDLSVLSDTITKVLAFNPEKLELFDRKTWELSKQFPESFKESFFPDNYESFIKAFTEKITPTLDAKDADLVMLAQLSGIDKPDCEAQLRELQTSLGAEVGYTVTDPLEQSIYWAIRYSSLALVASHSTLKPAALLEDLVIPIHAFGPFYKELTNLIAAHELECAIHGHAGNVHLHFYPLMDFTDPKTPIRIKELADTFFALAEKYQGTISGEHNDGIVRTPYLNKIYTPEWISLFEKTKTIFDPHNLFNPGKKVFPRYDFVQSIRHDNDPGFFRTQ